MQKCKQLHVHVHVYAEQQNEESNTSQYNNKLINGNAISRNTITCMWKPFHTNEIENVFPLTCVTFTFPLICTVYVLSCLYMVMCVSVT